MPDNFNNEASGMPRSVDSPFSAAGERPKRIYNQGKNSILALLVVLLAGASDVVEAVFKRSLTVDGIIIWLLGVGLLVFFYFKKKSLSPKILGYTFMVIALLAVMFYFINESYTWLTAKYSMVYWVAYLMGMPPREVKVRAED